VGIDSNYRTRGGVVGLTENLSDGVVGAATSKSDILLPPTDEDVPVISGQSEPPV
jgi:hypothetical protein